MSREDVKRLNMISMLVLVAKKRYGCVSKSGIIKVMELLRYVSREKLGGD